jgi:hypothetical protein
MGQQRFSVSRGLASRSRGLRELSWDVGAGAWTLELEGARRGAGGSFLNDDDYFTHDIRISFTLYSVPRSRRCRWQGSLRQSHLSALRHSVKAGLNDAPRVSSLS